MPYFKIERLRALEGNKSYKLYLFYHAYDTATFNVTQLTVVCL